MWGAGTVAWSWGEGAERRQRRGCREDVGGAGGEPGLQERMTLCLEQARLLGWLASVLNRDGEPVSKTGRQGLQFVKF